MRDIINYRYYKAIERIDNLYEITKQEIHEYPVLTAEAEISLQELYKTALEELQHLKGLTTVACEIIKTKEFKTIGFDPKNLITLKAKPGVPVESALNETILFMKYIGIKELLELDYDGYMFYFDQDHMNIESMLANYDNYLNLIKES
jgi:hypothetical protein